MSATYTDKWCQEGRRLKLLSETAVRPSISGSVMSLLMYFQVANRTLPKADGSLSAAVPSPSIVAASKEVKQLPDKACDDHMQLYNDNFNCKRGTNERFTAEENARIGNESPSTISAIAKDRANDKMWQSTHVCAHAQHRHRHGRFKPYP